MTRSNSPSDTKSVRFGTITITEFYLELGDNPACSSGAPVQLSGIPVAGKSFTRKFELFDFCRQKERRERKKLYITEEKRARMFLKAGYTMDELVEAIVQIDAIKKSRIECLHSQGWERFAT